MDLKPIVEALIENNGLVEVRQLKLEHLLAVAQG
jgi:hypothetical protein